MKTQAEMGGQYRIDLKELAINTNNWVDSAQHWGNRRALVNATLIFRVP